MENPSRRRVLTAGLSGALATALVGSRVSATTPTEPPTDSAAQGGADGGAEGGPDADQGGVDEDNPGAADAGEATTASSEPTATEAPIRPTESDIELLAFAQGAELAAVELYAAAIDAGASGDGDEALTVAMDNHQAAGDALSALIGQAAPQTAAPDIIAAWEDRFAGADLADVAAVGQELENTLVATHNELIGQLENHDALSRIAAILIAEAQMAAVLADLAGNGDDLAALFDNPAAALTPSEA